MEKMKNLVFKGIEFKGLDIKGLEFINLNSVFHDNLIRYSLPDPLKDDEVPSIVYSLANTIWNKKINYKETVNNVNTTDTLIYETRINFATAKIQIL